MDHPLREGTRIKTVAWEGNAPEIGTVMFCDDMREAWGTPGPVGFSYVIAVEGTYLDGNTDDGLRELSGDQIDCVLGVPEEGCTLGGVGFSNGLHPKHDVEEAVKSADRRARPGYPWTHAH